MTGDLPHGRKGRKGRRRLTPEDLHSRVRDYCRRHGGEPTHKGLPPFPAGRRETAQHREWISLYKLEQRLRRRALGLCERCDEPAVEESIFCEAHRNRGGASPEPAPRAPTGSGASIQARIVLAAQGGRCPVCGDDLAPKAALADLGAAGEVRALLHPRCHELVTLVDALGAQALEGARRYLRSRASARGQ